MLRSSHECLPALLVFTVLGDELVVGALLEDDTVVEQHDLVGVADGGEAVGDGDDGHGALLEGDGEAVLSMRLVNGSDRKDIAPAATATQTFAMAPVPEDSAYGISILRQPDGRTCTVEKPSGKMLTADINDIVVRCTQ